MVKTDGFDRGQNMQRERRGSIGANRQGGKSPPNRRSRLKTTFKDIDFGEDDANLEYEISQRDSKIPIFIQAFFDHPQLNVRDLEDGRRYLVLGQKGTGKTAILRKIQATFERDGGLTQFMIFRDEVASREELDRLGQIFAVNVNDVKKTHHHFYTLERLLLLILLAKLKEASNAAAEEDKKNPDPQSQGGIRGLVDRIVNQPIKRIVDVALETVEDVASVISVDASKVSKGAIHVDNNVLLRKVNERLFRACVSAIRKSEARVAVFIDEIHFTYRFGQDHDQDAGLVRDLIRAVNKINRELRAEKITCLFYAAIRSEYLEHPLISAAELHPVLSAYGTEISWATFAAGFDHPMFEIGARRVDVSTDSQFTGREFMVACFANFTSDDAADFVRSTWSKPRDMIRFLRTCKEMFPDKITLSKGEYQQVFHRSCLFARKEIEMALSSFLTTKGLEQLTTLFSTYSSQSLEKGSIGTIPEFIKKLAPIAKQQTQVGSINQPETLFRLLYMLGAVFTVRPIPGQNLPIMHSFHRGNPNPDPDGLVSIHRGIAKSFS